MKNIKSLLCVCLIACICLCAVGCKKVNDNNSSSLSSTVTQTETSLNNTANNKSEIYTDSVNKLQSQIASLKNTVSELSELNKITQNNINSLNKQIEFLKNENTTLKNAIKSSDSNKNSLLSTDKYKITKENLIGTWSCLNFNQDFVFTDKNVEVIDNWLIWENRFYQYAFIDGKLYISDDGFAFEKK